MAEPLRKDPDYSPSPRTPAERQFNVHRYGDPNRGSRHWWFWILLAVIVVWFVVWGVGNRSKKSNPANTAPVVNPAPSTPASSAAVDVASLLSNKEHYIGHQVLLRDVLVQSVNDSASVFVGANSGQQVLVLLKKGSIDEDLQGKPRAIPKGGILTITGTATKPDSVTDLEHSAKISRKEAKQVVKQGVMVEADRAAPQTM